jgi:hypothetical protein
MSQTMQQSNAGDREQQVSRAIEQAPGAIPPTGGTPPEEGAPTRPAAEPGVDELVDGLNLLLRAARQLEPRGAGPTLSDLEAAAERSIAALQSLEQTAPTNDALTRRIKTASEAIARELREVIAHAVAIVDTTALRQ